jgi:Cys-tRNA(Pro) deacylase
VTKPSDPKIAEVVAAGRELGIEVVPLTFPAGTRTAVDAAREVGCQVGQIAKSLVFQAGDEPVLLIVSGANRVDLKAAATALGVEEVTRADADAAKLATGFSIGATPPFGHRRALQVVMDEDLLQHDQVWAAGGRPDTVFAVEPRKLAEAARATIGDIKERRA